MPSMPFHVCRFLALAWLVAASSLHAAERPNIVFILVDDMSPTAAGFAGNKEVKTPNLDRIAREGANLTHCFTTTPVCSPSRATIVTSRYGTELGIIDWINHKVEPEHGLNPNAVTWMELLQEAGYASCLSGKWHLGRDPQFHPTLTGYDEFMGILEGGSAPHDPMLEVNGHMAKTSGFVVDLVTDHALDFIRRTKDKPFLLSLHYREPHSAWLPVHDDIWAEFSQLDPMLPDPDYPLLDVDKVKRMTREYYASIAAMDRNVGRVLDLLDELQLADNTVVIFTSDHGYHTGHQGIWFKGNAQWQLTKFPEQQWENIPPRLRPNLFDQALRTPALVRWPGIVQPGSTVDHTITFLDWYPTLLRMAQVEQPAELPLRGRDFTPLLRGEQVAWNEEMYAEYSMRHGATTDMRCWRTPEWKLIVDFANEGRRELYHLADDPRERINLVDSIEPGHVAVRQELEQKLMHHLRDKSDPVLAGAN